jgi:ABC-type multidrug transport system fused ATPase/permease subunit
MRWDLAITAITLDTRAASGCSGIVEHHHNSFHNGALGFLLQNPYFSLLRTAWRYVRAERKRYVLVYALFLCANFVYGSYPLLLGWFIDKIQRRQQQQIPHYVLVYAAAYVGLKLLEWGFHGPARVMERQLAFNLSGNFLNERYHQALHLPVKWHQDHHSGSTINRIRKAYKALRQFFDGGFTYIYAISRLAVSFTAMLIFAPLFGGIGALLGVLAIWIIVPCDGPIIRTQEEANEGEHVVAATLFDSLSNIMTVVTLRLEQSMEGGLARKIQRLLHPFRRNAVINEWKWFVVDTLVAVTYCVIVAGYVFEHWPAKPAQHPPEAGARQTRGADWRKRQREEHAAGLAARLVRTRTRLPFAGG